MPPIGTNPLNDEQLERLEEILKSRENAMSIEMLDGFMTAMHCMPGLALPSHYLGLILGEEEFEDADEATEILSLLMQHWNSVSRSLRGDEEFDPFLYEDNEQILGMEWCVGFWTVVEAHADTWSLLDQEKDLKTIKNCIFILATEYNDYPGEPQRKISQEERNLLLAAGLTGVPELHDFFHPDEAAHGTAPPPPEKCRKTGRNEPCPCGSGKKYKKCCGR